MNRWNENDIIESQVCVYDLGDGSYGVVTGDCLSDTDNGHYVDGTVTSVNQLPNGDLGIGFANNDDGTGGSVTVMGGLTPYNPFSYQLTALVNLQQQNYFSNMQQMFGSQTSAQRMQAIANALPTVCGGGAFFYAGYEGNLGPVHGFAGSINEYDTRTGHTGGFLVEGGAGEGIEGGGGVIYTPGGGTSGLAYGGFGLETPVASASAGVVGFSSGAGVYVGGSIGPYGGGVGGYLNITSAAGCRQ